MHLMNANNSELISIGKYAFCESTIETITIPSNVTTIDEGAFSNCINLKTVKFAPNSKLKHIREFSFNNVSIREILIPSKTTIIDKNSFSNCAQLKITIGYL